MSGIKIWDAIPVTEVNDNIKIPCQTSLDSTEPNNISIGDINKNINSKIESINKKNAEQDSEIAAIKAKDVAQDSKLTELDKEINEYNISAITGKQYASLQDAIAELNTYLKDGKAVGLKCTFVKTSTNKAETWMYQGGSFVNVESWKTERAMREYISSYNIRYNSITGFYELNGLTDITETQAMQIINESCNMDAKLKPNALAYSKIRTNLQPYRRFTNPSIAYMFLNSRIEVVIYEYVSAYPSKELTPASMEGTFNACRRLKKVIGILDTYFVDRFEYCFAACDSLESIFIKRLKINIHLGSCSKLSKESILYMIENSAAQSPITITLHPTAYAMAIADKDIIAALEKQPNISLASA